MLKNQLTFYSLLFFEKNEKIINLSRFNSDKKKEIIYSKMALNLSKSIHKQGFKHILITNQKQKIKSLVNYNYPIYEIKFNKLLNKKTKFYSAHFKIDVLKLLSKKKNKSCLIDLDILITKKFTKKFLYLLKNYNLLYSLDYNLYNKKINLTYKLLANLNFKTPKWYGGEFILGNKLFFKKLYKEIDILYPKYIKNINHFFHIGDETLLNCAIQKLLLKNNFFFKDIKGKKIIYRHWSIIKNSKFKLEYALKNIFLHAPGDKFFISRLNFNYLNFNLIKHKYSNHHNSIIRAVLLFLINKMKKLFI